MHTPNLRCHRLAILCTAAVLMFAGCDDPDTEARADDAGTDAGTDEPGADAGGPRGRGDAAALEADAGAPASMRGVRYCEILLGTPSADGVDVEVWGTQGLNLCPAEVWNAITEASITEETGAPVVRLNGPRYWTVDGGVAFSVPDAEPRILGGLEMRQLATLSISADRADAGSYTETVVDRDTELTFFAGSEAYELTAPNGAVYTMQSYAQIVDPSLSEADLPGLGDRLELPDGWTYAGRVLDEPLALRTEGDAVVLQDELQNSYSRTVEGMGPPPDGWATFAEAFFVDYCTECHAGAPRDYTSYEDVVRDQSGIRCGVTSVPLDDCVGFPPPRQFPVGPGPKPDDETRARLVEWIEAGLPR
jgi:hypothetical protein